MNVLHQQKVAELVDLFAASLKLECERLYRSGGIDPEKFDRHQYVLAKILITAAIERLKDDYSPADWSPHVDDVKNLIKM